MQKTSSQHTLNRRRLLKALAAGGLTAAGGYALYEAAPWIDYEEQARRIRRTPEREPSLSAQMQGLVHYATLAASGHNTQPWKFLIRPGAIEIHPDFSRRLAVVDPEDRELWISLGCALENLRVAAHAVGVATQIVYPDADDFILIRLTADTAQGSLLFDAIPQRQNTRSEYDGKPVRAADLDQVQAQTLEPGIVLHFVLEPNGLKMVSDYVRQGNLSQFADRAFMKELIHWLRFNKREALAACDGLFSRCTGNPEVPRWIGERFVAGTKPQKQADADARKLHSSSGVVIVASESEGKTAWVRTGQVYERLALKMTSLNIKSAFLNQPIEVPSVCGQFQSAANLGAAQPQLMVRFGYAEALPFSLRRPVEQVIV